MSSTVIDNPLPSRLARQHPGKEPCRSGAEAGLAGAPAEVYPARMRWEDHITVTPGVRSGKLCIAGTRVTVQDVLEYLASGMSEAEILADFPSLTHDSVRAVLAFAATRERRLATPAT